MHGIPAAVVVLLPLGMLHFAHSGMSPKRVAIVQSSYIPWKGYFDLIRAVDEFILLDDVQFTKRDWRSRNRIQTKDGPHWLSIPIHTRGLTSQRVMDARVADQSWSRRHWQTISNAYARAPYFADYARLFQPLYERPVSQRLSEINHSLITSICLALHIKTPITWSTDYSPVAGSNQRLIDLCLKSGATEYLSGPSAASYIDEGRFASAGITVRFVDYGDYPEYPQLFSPFEHAVSALDLLFCTGRLACTYMKNLSPQASAT